jgi:hypothetical protein
LFLLAGGGRLRIFPSLEGDSEKPGRPDPSESVNLHKCIKNKKLKKDVKLVDFLVRHSTSK